MMQLRNAPKIIPLFLVVYAVLTVSTSVHQTKAQVPDALLPLSWERNRESDTIDAGAVGAGVEVGLTLATFPEAVWDNGVFTPIENRLSVPTECNWASWTQRYAVDVRHFRATFSFPDGLDPASKEGVLFDPCYEDDLVPINDNLYVFVNGVEQFRGGTNYGALNGGYQGTSPLANETDGWYVPGGIRIDGFRTGENVLDIVTEERAQWGGLGYLELRLVPRSPPTEITVTIEVPQTLTLNQDGWYAENPAELRATVTNNTAEAFSGDLEITFSDSSRLVFGEGDEFLEHPNRLTHHIDSLAAGGSLPQAWKLWVQPMTEQSIVFTGKAINSAGELLGEGAATMSVPTASIHPVVVIPGWPGSFKNFDGQWEIDPIKGTYNNLLEELKFTGYNKEDSTLFTFPYDWRRDVNLNAIELGQNIAYFLQSASTTGKAYVDSSSVDIVGHSGGGLVSRAYIQGSNYGDNVHRLITLGTPHQGTPKAYLAAEGLEFDFLDDIGDGGPILAKAIIHALAWKNGYCTSIPLITEVKCIPFDFNVSSFVEKEAPSIRQAFPTDSYLSDDPGGYLVSADDPDYEYPFGHQVNEFLTSLNGDIDTLIDRLGANNIIAVVGDRPQLDTDSYYEVVERNLLDILFGIWRNGRVKEGREFREPSSGDETVPLMSADLSLVDWQVQTALKTSTDDNLVIKHGNMPTQLQKSIVEYLTKTRPFFNAGFIDPEIDLLKGLMIFNLSPVEIQVTDPLGRRSGLDFLTGNEFTEIPGAFFSRSNLPNEPDFIFIPDALDGEYRINLKGIDEGDYRVVVQSLGEQNILAIAEFSGSTAPGQEHEHKTTYDPEAVPATPLSLEWLPPLENTDEIFNFAKNRIVPIKFTIRDAHGEFIADNGVIVWVIDPEAPSEVIAAFTITSSGLHGKSDVVRINGQEELYIVNLHLSDDKFIPGKPYAMGVSAFGEQLGIIGIFVKGN